MQVLCCFIVLAKLPKELLLLKIAQMNRQIRIPIFYKQNNQFQLGMRIKTNNDNNHLCAIFQNLGLDTDSINGIRIGSGRIEHFFRTNTRKSIGECKNVIVYNFY